MPSKKREFVPTIIDFSECAADIGVLYSRQNMFGIINGQPYALRLANIIPLDEKVHRMIKAFATFDTRLKMLIKYGPYPKEDAVWLNTYGKTMKPFIQNFDKIAEKVCHEVWCSGSEVMFSKELAWNKIKIITLDSPPDYALRVIGNRYGNEVFAFTKQHGNYKFALFHNANTFDPYVRKSIRIAPWLWYDLEHDEERNIFTPARRNQIIKELDIPLRQNEAKHLIDSLYFRKLKTVIKTSKPPFIPEVDLLPDEVKSLSMTVEDFKGWRGNMKMYRDDKGHLQLEKEE